MTKLRTYRNHFIAALALAGLATAGMVVAQIEDERGIAPVSSNGDLEVDGLEIDVRGDSPDDARYNGWREAQRQGWQALWRKMGRGGGAPRLSDGQLDGLVSAIIVENEQIGPRRYIATLGVMFDRARAGQMLGISGNTLRSAPLLVIPVTVSGGSLQVFESRTEWQKAWARFRTADSRIDYVRPHGSGGESVLLTAGQTGRRSRTWWRLILDQFGAADVIMPIARLERQWPGGPIRGTFTARFGPDNRLIESFTLTAQNSDGLPKMLDQAIKRLDGIYGNALSSGMLAPDPTLVIVDPNAPPPEELKPEEEKPTEESVETREKAEAAPDPTPSATRTLIAVQFDSPDPDAVAAAESALRGIAGVQSANTTSVALGGTSVMQVVFTGEIDALRGALQARGWQVQQGSGALRIRR